MLIFSAPPPRNETNCSNETKCANGSSNFITITELLRDAHSYLEQKHQYSNNWIENEEWKVTLIHSIFWTGNIIGTFLWGISNDKYGRKRTIFWSNFVYFLGNLGTSLSILIYHFMADFEAK